MPPRVHSVGVYMAIVLLIYVHIVAGIITRATIARIEREAVANAWALLAEPELP